jgi:DNA-binding ferritin-like protein
MANFIGSSDTLHLFTEGSWGVVVDSEINLIVASGAATVLSSSRKWATADVDSDIEEIASESLSSLIAAGKGSSSKYTIPKSVKAEAEKALEWRKEEKRGGTSVGLNTARTLARGGQIGIEKVRHIAKYFPRHEVDKKAEGWKPGEDGFPSNGRIAWALWGGDAAWRWASTIVEREEKKALRADGYALNEVQKVGPDIKDFSYEDEGTAPEFLTRVRLDGTGMDRLYKVDPDHKSYVWDDGKWDDLGMMDATVWDYDSELDYENDDCEKSHILIDPESAIIIGARLFVHPSKPVMVEEIDAYEAELAAASIDEVDWDFVDRVITAAGETEDDGDYTPEERAENAAEQVRDKQGRFAKTGASVVVAGDQNNGRGIITGQNPDTQEFEVQLANGTKVNVAGNLVESANLYPARSEYPADTDITAPPIDTSGILGEPRTPVNRAVAQLPGTLPAMNQQSLSDMLANWDAWVKNQRDSFIPGPTASPVKVQRKNSLDSGDTNFTKDAYDHPLLQQWLKGTDRLGYKNSMWYNPITAAGSEPKTVTPDTSDVQPVYMAVVDSDDPRAVLDLISLVPASTVSTAPMVYKRNEGKWERDPKILADLSSATPPPVVPLNTEDLNDVLQQVDETQGVEKEPVTASIALTILFGGDALVAAGGADRNRGGAAALRRYWTKGKGAAKIRWGTPGDWKRCVRQLSKYMGVRAKGYCQLRHKEATGVYTGSRLNPGRENSIAVPGENDDDLSITTVEPEDMHLPLKAILAETAEEEDGWQPDEEILLILSDPESLYEEEFALVAAGGADRNRGNAEKLRRYWTKGKGGLKIRWGTPGDWTRCVRNLQKYMGPRAKGYCALRHKEMNGVWPGDRKNRETSIMASVEPLGYAIPVKSTEDIIQDAALRARTAELRAQIGMTAGAEVSVANFFIPEPIYRTEDMEDLVEELEPVDEQAIAIDDLIPTQETVDLENVEEVMDSEKPVSVLITEDGPLLVDGHHRTSAYRLRGEDEIPAEIYRALAASAGQFDYDLGYSPEENLSSEDETLIATAGSKPAPKKDQIKGSEKNKKGSAGTGAGVSFTAKIEEALSNKVTKHNEKAKDGRKANLRTLKAVYRRGAGAFSTSHRPDQNRNSWAMARVNAYLHLLKTGSPKNKKYTTDNDLLPASHPKSSKKSNSILAAGAYHVNDNTYKAEGSRFKIPLVIPEEMESGDGRKFKKGAIELRELPLPLLWQISTGSGHDGSVVVGRIDHMERTDDGIGNAYGYFDTGEYGKEAERLVREGFLRGVSADMDKFEASEEVEEEVVTSSKEGEEDKTIKKEKIVISKARVMAVTIVPKPAFQECKIFLDQETDESPEEDEMIPDGIYVENVEPAEAEAVVASGMIAGAIPTTPPQSWFQDPKLSQPTPLTVTDEGRVYGHIAAWHVDHIGMVAGTKPPRSRSKYSYFHTGVVRTEEGADVPVGQITLAGGHADIRASAAEAVKHYDDTASAVIDVHAGEDSHGIWVAGSLRPGVTPEQVRALRASAPSGDWRPIRGSLELVAVCQVNVPGFPIARAMVAGGQITALVAAGASALAKMRSNPVDELNERVARLEADKNAELFAAAEEARAKFAALRPAKADLEFVADEEVSEAVTADAFYEDVQPQLVDSLAKLLADVVALSFIAQGYHWNVKGRNFPQYHEMFGEIYSDIYGSVDPLAENILKLGYDAPFTLSAFATMSELAASATMDNSCEAMAYDLYIANQIVIQKLKEAFAVADASNEQGVADFLSGRIDMHQKWGWQLKASSQGHEMPSSEEEVVVEEPYTEYFEVIDYSDRDALVAEFSMLSEFKIFTADERKKLAKDGKAMRDGSYPIRNKSDLKNAIRAYGRAKSKAAAKRHIIKRARALGETELIPQEWNFSDVSVEDLNARITEFSAKVETAE